jgi:hypothetical protein
MMVFATYPSLEYQMMFLLHIHLDTFHKTDMERGLNFYSFHSDTSECFSAISNYFDYRKRCGEILTDKSPLIREQFNKDNPFTINTPRFLSERGIERIIDADLKRSGIRGGGEVHMSHGFRKFFFSECEKSGMKSINVKMLMGHNIGVSGHYYLPSIYLLNQIY